MRSCVRPGVRFGVLGIGFLLLWGCQGQTGSLPTTPPLLASNHLVPIVATDGQWTTLPRQSNNPRLIASWASRQSSGDFAMTVDRPRARTVMSVDEPMPYTDRFTRQNGKQWPKWPTRLLRRVQQTPELTVGAAQQFWINRADVDGDADIQRRAILKRVSPHAWFFMDAAPRTSFSDEQWDRLVDEFELNIYPRVTQVFGAEAQPGVDGHQRIFIVISPAVDNWGAAKGMMGYFWSRDALPGVGGRSNHKEVLFLTDQLFNYPALTSFGTLAHEFQHLINFTRRFAREPRSVPEDTWLDEGLSMYAMEVAGYGLPAGDRHVAKDLNETQQNPHRYSLTDWNGNPHGFSYGQSYLFVRYLVDRFGLDVVQRLMNGARAGEANVEDCLATSNTTFKAVFRDWAIANLVTDEPWAAETPYHYRNLRLNTRYGDFDLKGFATLPLGNSQLTLSLRPWSSTYYRLEAPEPSYWRTALPATIDRENLLGTWVLP